MVPFILTFKVLKEYESALLIIHWKKRTFFATQVKLIMPFKTYFCLVVLLHVEYLIW